MAPILTFTAEEAFAVFSPNESGTIFTETNHEVPAVENAEKLLQKWTAVRAVRSVVLKKIEELRSEGKVGSSLAADCIIMASGADYQYLASLGEELKFVMMTSKASLVEGADSDTPLTVTVEAAPRKKCIRCWHYVDGTEDDAEHTGLCPRCRENLFGTGEKRLFA